MGLQPIQGLACMRARSSRELKYLIEDHPFASRLEPFALGGWMFDMMYCNPKGSKAFLQILSMKGRGVGLCWAFSKPQGLRGCDPKESKAFVRIIFTEGRGVGLCWAKSRPKGPTGKPEPPFLLKPPGAPFVQIRRLCRIMSRLSSNAHSLMWPGLHVKAEVRS